MSGNGHYEGAIAGLLQAAEGSGCISEAVAMAAVQTQATLALAYEQRTANLIAVFGNLLDDEVVTFLGERVDGYELAKVIQERLGL